MQRVAFKMKLLKGYEKEYEDRHRAIWPELSQLLKEAGITEYSIFLDEETNILFGYFKKQDDKHLDKLPSQAVMKKWWAYMKDIMETNADFSPVSTPLKEVFYME